MKENKSLKFPKLGCKEKVTYMSVIRVLVVDDSVVFREAISRGISRDPNIEVVGKAVDPYDARDKLLRIKSRYNDLRCANA